MAQVRDPHALERLRHPGLDLGVRVAVAARRERHVVPDRGRDDLFVDVLEQHADPLPDAIEVPGRIDAEHRDLSLLGLEQAEDVEQQGRLAAAVGAQDHDPLAPVDLEVEPAQVHLGAIGIGVANARDPDDRIAHRTLHQARAAAATSAPTPATSQSARLISA